MVATNKKSDDDDDDDDDEDDAAAATGNVDADASEVKVVLANPVAMSVAFLSKPTSFDWVDGRVVKEAISGEYNTRTTFRNQPKTPLTLMAVMIAKGAATAGFLISSEMCAVAS
jgi:hypothetical protein